MQRNASLRSAFALSLLLIANSSQAAPNLYVLFATDPHPEKIGADIGPGCRKNRALLLQILKEIFTGPRHDRLQTYDVNPKDFTLKNIQTFFADKIHPNAEDTLLFYYNGHGEMQPDGTHIFDTSQGRFSRQQVRLAMSQTKAHLAILISDTCSSYAAGASDVPPRRVPAEWEGFKDLFFTAHGIVDFTAATPGEFAWFTDDGGLFSLSFLRLLCEKKTLLDTDHDGVVTWNEVFAQARADTNRAFLKRKARAAAGEEIRKSNGQHPKQWFLAQEPVLTKNIHVQNDSSTECDLWGKFYVQSDDGAWSWTKPLHWTLAPGMKTYLTRSGVRIQPTKLVWWASDSKGHSYGDKEAEHLFYPYPQGSKNKDDTELNLIIHD